MTNEFYCKQITTVQTDQLFVFTHFYPSDDKTDENGAIHVQVTDGKDWFRSKAQVYAEDLIPSRGGSRLLPALEALTDKYQNNSGIDFEISLEQDNQDGQLYLVVRFVKEGASTKTRLRIALQQDPLPQSALTGALNTLLENLKHLRASTSKLRQHKKSLELIASQSRALVEQHVATASKAERQQFEGVAMLLNAKKEELRDAAEMSVDDAESMEVGSSDEEEGAEVEGAEPSGVGIQGSITMSELETAQGEEDEDSDQRPVSPDRDDW